MTTRRWLGQAKNTRQVNTITIANTWALGDTVTVSVAGVDFVVTVGSQTSTAQVATTVKQAWNAETLTDTSASSSPTFDQRGARGIPHLSAITASVVGSIVSLTADEDGVPFTVTVTEATAGTGTATGAVSIAATGENFWSDADNWSGATVPVDTDDVIIGVPVSILYGLDQSAVTLASLVVEASFDNAAIGLKQVNDNGASEYRDTYLKIGATVHRIGVGDGNASHRIKIDFGAVQTTGEIRKSAESQETNVPAILLKGTHNSNAFDIQNASVGFAFFGGETATLSSLRTAAQAKATCGEGCSLTTVIGQGRVRLNSAATTVTMYDGEWEINGASTITTLTTLAGTFLHKGSGTITTANIGGTLDCSLNASARTITTTVLNPGGVIIDPNSTLIHTNKIAWGTGVKSFTAAA